MHIYTVRVNEFFLTNVQRQLKERTVFFATGTGTIRHLYPRKMNLDPLHIIQKLAQNG